MDIQDVVSEATAFIGDCYGISDGETMSDKRQAFVFCSTLYAHIIMLLHFFLFRYRMWIKRARGKLSNAPKLANLPPTSESFLQNVLRAHYQCAVWKSCLLPDPPAVDPTMVRSNIFCSM